MDKTLLCYHGRYKSFKKYCIKVFQCISMILYQNTVQSVNKCFVEMYEEYLKYYCKCT